MVTVSGRVRWSHVNGDTNWFGPAGYKASNSTELGSAIFSGRQLNVSQTWVNYNELPGQPVRYIDSIRTVWTIRDSVWIDRSNPNINDTDNDSLGCGPSYPGSPCLTFSGSTTLTVNRVPVNMILSADSTRRKGRFDGRVHVRPEHHVL